MSNVKLSNTHDLIEVDCLISRFHIVELNRRVNKCQFKFKLVSLAQQWGNGNKPKSIELSLKNLAYQNDGLNNLLRAKLLCENGTSYIDELNINFSQIPIQTKTFLKNMIEIKVLKLKIKGLKHF